MRYRIAPDVVWMADDGEVRLYDAGSGEFRTLNSTGAELWILVSEGQPVNAITSEMARRYAAADTGQTDVVVQDVRDFLDALAGQGLLLADDVTPSGTPGPPA
ncbi:PqqD family protein [Streptomyces sp. NPDC021225]|uniref:PqqD family protein n=1 Tax=Streptomyces sp. NPDC021225 TaxID=3365121 RepID=UPI003799C076